MCSLQFVYASWQKATHIMQIFRTNIPQTAKYSNLQL